MNLNLKFASHQQDFFVTLSQRVNSYFKTNKIERTANAEMVIKTIFMFTLYIKNEKVLRSLFGSKYMAPTRFFGFYSQNLTFNKGWNVRKLNCYCVSYDWDLRFLFKKIFCYYMLCSIFNKLIGLISPKTI